MLRSRVIPILLIQDKGLVKTTRFGAPKYVGDPINAVRIFNEKEAGALYRMARSMICDYVGHPALSRLARFKQRQKDEEGAERHADRLVQGHVHEFDLSGMRSADGRGLVHSKAYYTVNEIPRKE